MAKKAIITTITSTNNNATNVNANDQAINDKLDNTLSLDGSTPNAMNADFDLNNQDLINGGEGNFDSVKVGGSTLVPATKVPDWEGAWVTATAYAVDDLVKESGNVYICLVAHTSGTFATDLAANDWELFASKGDAGAGTGDMLAANNLSDVANADTSLANLGGGTKGIAIFKDTTNAAIHAELNLEVGTDLQAWDAYLDDLAGLTQAQNKIPYMDSATTAALLDFVDEDGMDSDSATALPSQQSVKAYVDSKQQGMVFLATDNLSSDTSSDFTAFDATKYDAYCFILQNVVPVTDAVALDFRTSTNGGSTYDSGASDYMYSYAVSDHVDVGNKYDSSDPTIELASSVGSAAGEDGVSGTVWVLGPHLTKKTQIVWDAVFEDSNGDLEFASGGGQRNSAADVDACRFLFSSGNMESGTITMYGVKNA